MNAILEEQSYGGTPDLTLGHIKQVFPFALDSFQEQAIEVTMSGDSLVACAPTGAGKTAIAIGAILAAVSQGWRVVYTTPLKALSNQKLIELAVRHSWPCFLSRVLAFTLSTQDARAKWCGIV